ncbi:hypothetical protein HK102_011716 [Quaeritorhiza haematococci]|nr:hypothetical protein HK102_011716 [Quaeritorhiza haematococci]
MLGLSAHSKYSVRLAFRDVGRHRVRPSLSTPSTHLTRSHSRLTLQQCPQALIAQTLAAHAVSENFGGVTFPDLRLSNSTDEEQAMMLEEALKVPIRTSKQRYWRSNAAQRVANKECMAEADELLRKAIQKYGIGKWSAIAQDVKSRSGSQCQIRSTVHLSPGLHRGRWTPKEDQLLIDAVEELGTASWGKVAERVSGRSTGQCRVRWRRIAKQLSPSTTATGETSQDDIHSAKGMNEGREEAPLETASLHLKLMLKQVRQLRGMVDVREWKETHHGLEMLKGKVLEMKSKVLEVLPPAQAMDVVSDDVQRMPKLVSERGKDRKMDKGRIAEQFGTCSRRTITAVETLKGCFNRVSILEKELVEERLNRIGSKLMLEQLERLRAKVDTPAGKEIWERLKKLEGKVFEFKSRVLPLAQFIDVDTDGDEQPRSKLVTQGGKLKDRRMTRRLDQWGKSAEQCDGHYASNTATAETSQGQVGKGRNLTRRPYRWRKTAEQLDGRYDPDTVTAKKSQGQVGKVRSWKRHLD